MSFFNPSDQIDTHKRKLPHWQQGDVWVFVTWRLADSLPQSKLRDLERERQIWLSFNPKPWSPKIETEYYQRFSDRIDEWLDQGIGSCLLRKAENAAIVANALEHFHDQRYRLASYVVMPNHAHVLFQLITPHSLPAVMKSWKNFSALQINRREQRSGSLWQPEYWDRLIRSPEHCAHCADYIGQNPIKARLRPGEFVLREFPGAWASGPERGMK